MKIISYEDTNTVTTRAMQSEADRVNGVRLCNTKLWNFNPSPKLQLSLEWLQILRTFTYHAQSGLYPISGSDYRCMVLISVGPFRIQRYEFKTAPHFFRCAKAKTSRKRNKIEVTLLWNSITILGSEWDNMNRTHRYEIEVQLQYNISKKTGSPFQNPTSWS